jgi:hypothetical protein
MGVEEGGAVALAGRGLTASWTRCGIEVGGGGVDTALPQVQFHIARACDCMIERKGEASWCTGDKNHSTISHLRGCNCDYGDHSDLGGQEEAGRGAGQQQDGGRLQSGSLQPSS